MGISPHFASYYRYLVIHHLFNKQGYKFNKILDVGCDDGFITSRIDANLKVGIDLDRIDQKPHSLSFVLGDAVRLPFHQHEFDLVLAIDILEHVTDDRRAFKSIEPIVALH